jgi:hypothetical protein
MFDRFPFGGNAFGLAFDRLITATHPHQQQTGGNRTRIPIFLRIFRADPASCPIPGPLQLLVEGPDVLLVWQGAN